MLSKDKDGLNLSFRALSPQFHIRALELTSGSQDEGGQQLRITSAKED
jgi:hypothetical protein